MISLPEIRDFRVIEVSAEDWTLRILKYIPLALCYAAVFAFLFFLLRTEAGIYSNGVGVLLQLSVPIGLLLAAWLVSWLQKRGGFVLSVKRSRRPAFPVIEIQKRDQE